MPHGAIPFPFGDCRICNDKATGIHYGVATCEGCKGFFKRSLSKADRYKCFFGGQCKLSPQNRNRCKCCRFQRCVAMGMSVEAVKMGRIPKVDKERALEMHRYGDSNEQQMHSDGAHQMAPAGPWADDMTPSHMSSTPAVTLAHPSHSTQHQPPHSSGLSAPNDPPHSSGLSSQHQPPHSSGLSSQHQPPHSSGLSSQHQHPHSSGLSSQHQPPHSSGLSSQHQHPHSSGHSPPALQQLTHRITQNVMQDKGMGRDVSSMSSGPSHGTSYYPQKNSSAPYPPRYPNAYHSTSAAGHHHHPRQPSSYVSNAHNPHAVHKGPSNLPTPPPPRDMCYGPPRLINPDDVPLWDASHPHQMHMPDHPAGLRVAGMPEYLRNDMFKADVNKTLFSHSGSDSGVSDMTNSDQSVMEVDGSSQSPQGQLMRTSSGSIVPHGSVASAAIKSREVFSTAVIDTLLTHVIEETNVEQGVFDQPMELDVTRPNSDVLYTDVAVKVEIPDDHCPDANKNAPVYSDDLDYEIPCDLSAQEPTSSTERDDFDLKSLVSKDRFVRSPSPSGDSDCIGSSVDEDNAYLLAKSYKTIERLYLDKFDRQQSWIGQAHDVIRGNIKKHPWNSIHECSKEEAGKVWQNLFANIVPWNTRILGFCSEIPGFTQLNKDDQGYFLKAGYYDLWMLAVVCAFIEDESYVFFEDGMYYSRWWMMHFLPIKFVLLMTRFWTELSLLNLKPVEVGLLMAIRLVNPDREDVKQPELAQVLQDHYTNVLMYSLQQNHGTSSTQLWVKIMRILPSLDDINRAQDEVIGNFQVDATPDVWEENLRELESLGGDTKTLDFSSILKIRKAGPKNAVKLSNLLNR